MTPQDFVYWLQGCFELTDPKTLDEKQVQMIKNHLNLVFFHSIDPKATEGLSKEEAEKKQQVLNETHSPAVNPHFLPPDVHYHKLIRC
jgi:hypothetical protein